MSEDLDPKLIINHAQPDKLGAGVDGRSAALGVQLWRKGQWRLFYCLLWRDGKLFAKTSIFIRNRVVAEQRYSVLNNKKQKSYPVYLQNREIYISKEVSLDQVNDFAKILGTLSRDWVGLWRSVGGLKLKSSAPKP